MSDQLQSLRDAIRRIYEATRGEPDVSAISIANEVMVGFKKMTRPSAQKRRDGLTPNDVYLGCHHQCRQLAREMLRETASTDLRQHDLPFPGLQRRYPTARSRRQEEAIYRKLELLTEGDWLFNISRMGGEIESKQRHLDRFIAWGLARGFILPKVPIRDHLDGSDSPQPAGALL